MAYKRSAIVPRAVRAATFGSVIPACVALGLQACSNPITYGVAAVAYCCFEAGPGDGDADAKSDAPLLGVADVAFIPDATEEDVVTDAPEGG